MKKSTLATLCATLVMGSVLTGCASPVGSSSTSEESLCTKHADFIKMYENLVGLDGKFYVSNHAWIFGTTDTMREVGEPEPEESYVLDKRIEFVANSSFAQQCFSSSLRQAMIDYVNR